MRPDVVDKYIKTVLDKGTRSLLVTGDMKENKNWIKVIERIYRLNLDNRILNNLRQ